MLDEQESIQYAKKALRTAMRGYLIRHTIAHQMLQAAEYIQRLRYEISENAAFHPRANKLIRKRKAFLVVAIDEPYYTQVYNIIRIEESRKGTWTVDDQRRYDMMMEEKMLWHLASMNHNDKP